jgi:transcriptional regulator with XRE-family HTH domain
MPNKLREARLAAGLSPVELAERLDESPAHVALVERGESIVRLGTLMAMAQVLERPSWDLFPEAAVALRKIEEAPPEEQATVAEEDTVFRALLDACIDPDPVMWVVVIEFANGVIRKYPVCCLDLSRIRDWLRDGGREFITFQSDSRMIGVNRSAVRLCTLSKSSEWRPWNMSRQAMEFVLVRLGDDRPGSYQVCYDEPQAEELGQFQDIIAKLEGVNPQGFIEFANEDDETFFLPLREMAAVEIPIGILDADLYRAVDSHDSPLDQLQPSGPLH